MMRPRWLTCTSFLLFSGICESSLPAHAKERTFGPSIETAVKNGPQIFNAVNNAMRQFGSSLHHNGMSFFQATVPAGTVLYHGGRDADVPEGLEWLAFEIEHAEDFARGRLRPKDNSSKTTLPMPGPGHAEQWPLHPRQQQSESRSTRASLIAPGINGGRAISDEWDPDKWIFVSGYLHVYQATRPLNLVYIDGMAAGKTSIGTDDAQDFILVGNRTRHFMEDFQRAGDLCAWADKWQIDGFIRMEPGFEIVYCNFRDGGVNQVSALRRPRDMFTMEDLEADKFEWVRAASQRYRGIGGDRVVIDYSSMVSAFFYPLNLTNPNTTAPELPRLLNADDDQLAMIKAHIEKATLAKREKTIQDTDWQGVTDMIVARYADVLPGMAKSDTAEAMKRAFGHQIYTFTDFSTDDVDWEESEGRCARHFLEGTVTTTAEEELIYAGIMATTQLICGTLFQAYKLVQPSDSDDESLAGAVSLVRDLMDKLHWSKWKECGGCGPGEVCFIAMWPFGNVEDHYNPSCTNASASFDRYSYWNWEWDWM